MKARLLLLASIPCVLTACADTGREQLLEHVLEDRAEHLNEESCHALAEGISQAESRHGVDGLLLLAVMEHESEFRAGARSRKGALGLMQIREETAEEVAARHGIEWNGPEDLANPHVNISIGAAYLSELKERFGTWDLALAAYLNGPARVMKATEDGREVRSRYADRILERYDQLRDEYEGG